MVATTHTVSLQGAIGHVVDVQVDLSQGLIADRTRRTTRCLDHRGAGPVPGRGEEQRLRLARRPAAITVLLSPADLPKRGPHFDLAIAVAVLAAADQGLPASTRWSMRR